MERVLFIGLLLVLDVVLGTLAYRWIPDRIDEREFRVASDIYHHDLKPNTSAWANWGPLAHRIHTNSLGFKDASVGEIALETAGRRVLLIGDSFTEGIGMPFESSFAGLIQSHLAEQSVEVLNAGVISYAPTIYSRKVRYLMETVGLQFTEVVVFIDISDIEDEAAHYMLDSDGRVADQPNAVRDFHLANTLESGRFGRVKRFLVRHSLTVRLADTIKDRTLLPAVEAPLDTEPLAIFRKTLENDRGNWTHRPDVFDRYGRRGLERASKAMQGLWDSLNSAGKKLTVVVYPWPQQVVEADLESVQVTFWRNWADQRGVKFIDLFPTFIGPNRAQETLSTLYIPGDYHFNAAGNRRFAEAFLGEFVPAVPEERAAEH